MKISLVLDDQISRPGGVQGYTLGLYDWLHRQGHDVSIFTCGRPGGLKDNRKIFSFGKNVEIILNDASSSLPLVLNKGDQIKKFLRREKFDLLHYQGPLGFLSLQVFRYAQAPQVVTFHTLADDGPLVWLGRAFRSLPLFFSKSFQAKIAISSSAASFAHNFFEGQIEIIPPGIFWSRFAGGKPLNKFHDDKLNILFVGRFDKRKGLPYLLSAFRLVKEKIPQTRLILVGDGPEKTKIKAQIKEEKIKDVVMAGRVETQDLPNYFASAQVFCSPATHGESFGIVLLEAMAAGLPMVAFDNLGYTGVFPSWQRPFLVQNRNLGALTQALITLLSYPLLAKTIAEKNQLEVKKYDWEKVGPQIFAVYQKAQERFLKTKGRKNLKILPRDWFKIEKRLRSYASRIIST